MRVYQAAFEIPYDRPRFLRRRLRVDPPVRVDTALGPGTPPGQRLQRALRRKGRVNALDRLLAASFTLREIGPEAGAAGLAYALLLGFCLVYLGEHYVADLLAGGALAVAAAEPPAEPLARRIDELWRRLEP